MIFLLALTLYALLFRAMDYCERAGPCREPVTSHGIAVAVALVVLGFGCGWLR